MIILPPSNYHKLIEPLKEVKINTLFVRSVIEQKVDGFVYVDNTEMPQTFYVVHPYGISLLFGKTDNDIFNSSLYDYILNTFKIRNKYEWMQVYPDLWNGKILNLLGDKLVKAKDTIGMEKHNKIEEHTRVNFKFNIEKYSDFKNDFGRQDYKVLRTNKEMYENMQGSVVPKYFWKNSEQFCENGVGYSLIVENQTVSTAYSAFIHDNQLELGIETIESFRGKGCALYTCSALIDYCIEHNLEPVWSCRFENINSYKLAQKLGFEPTIYIPFYRLSD